MKWFYPISLKKKKPNKLIKELKNKGIEYVVDVRRKNITMFNSAIEYFPHQINHKLNNEGITYHEAFNLGNYNYCKTSEEYLTSDIRYRLLTVFIKDNILNINYSKEKVGFLCYCTEEAQENNECHASWISNFLNNQPIG